MMKPTEDGRPHRVVRVNGHDLAVHIQDFTSTDEEGDQVFVGIRPTERIGSKEALSPESLSAVRAVENILHEKLKTRSRLLGLFVNGAGNTHTTGATGLIQDGARLEEVIDHALDGVDTFEYQDITPENEKLVLAAKRLIADSMEVAQYPREGKKDVSGSAYYMAIGSIPATEGFTPNELRSMVEQIMHWGKMDGRIDSVSEEGGKIWLKMNLTVSSGNVLKRQIEKWKSAK